MMTRCDIMSTFFRSLPRPPVQSTRAWWAMPRSECLRGWKASGAGLGAPAPAAPQDRNSRADELLRNLASGESRDSRESRDTWRVQRPRGESRHANRLSGK